MHIAQNASIILVVETLKYFILSSCDRCQENFSNFVFTVKTDFINKKLWVFMIDSKVTANNPTRSTNPTSFKNLLIIKITKVTEDGLMDVFKL